MYVTANENKWDYLDNLFSPGRIFLSNEYGPISKRFLVDNNINFFTSQVINKNHTLTQSIIKYTYFADGEIKITTDYSVFPIDNIIDGGPAPNICFQFIKNQGGRKKYDFFKGNV